MGPREVAKAKAEGGAIVILCCIIRHLIHRNPSLETTVALRVTRRRRRHSHGHPALLRPPWLLIRRPAFPAKSTFFCLQRSPRAPTTAYCSSTRTSSGICSPASSSPTTRGRITMLLSATPTAGTYEDLASYTGLLGSSSNSKDRMRTKSIILISIRAKRYPLCVSCQLPARAAGPGKDKVYLPGLCRSRRRCLGPEMVQHSINTPLLLTCSCARRRGM